MTTTLSSFRRALSLATRVRRVSFSSRRPFSTTTNIPADSSPLETLQRAMESLEDCSKRLRALQAQVDHAHALPAPHIRTVTVPDICLHSRDAPLEEFQGTLAHQARELVVPHAQNIDEALRNLAEDYTTVVAPRMEAATRLCQETPCGGASWELDLERLKSADTTPGGNQRISLEGMQDTPCGRLQLASLQFLQTSYDTKAQIVMASRCLLILQLAIQFKAPLQHVRAQGTKEENDLIRTTFAQQVVPTPWIRTDEEYQQLLQLQDQLQT